MTIGRLEILSTFIVKLRNVSFKLLTTFFKNFNKLFIKNVDGNLPEEKMQIRPSDFDERHDCIFGPIKFPDCQRDFSAF